MRDYKLTMTLSEDEKGLIEMAAARGGYKQVARFCRESVLHSIQLSAGGIARNAKKRTEVERGVCQLCGRKSKQPGKIGPQHAPNCRRYDPEPRRRTR